MKYKVAELEGALLDAAVAKAQRGRLGPYSLEGGGNYGPATFRLVGVGVFAPSTDWSHGGPIIEREHIDLEHAGNRGEEGFDEAGDWRAYAPTRDGLNMFAGPTALVAAMRALVASKVGDEVELP